MLAQVPEISFRSVPDPEGDSCTFLSWFLPTEAITRAVVSEMKEQNILAGNFYWYDNNWHYIRKWDHLKQPSTLNLLHEDQRTALQKLQQKSFANSDKIMSRCISTAINLSWNEEQIEEKGKKMLTAIRKVLHQASTLQASI